MLEKEKFERVCKYLKTHRFLKTLAVLEKPKLSFEIIKPPKRIEIITKHVRKEKQTKKKVPEEFKKIAGKAGIDPKLFQFFYERREFFNWSLFKPMVHCTEKNCNYKTEHADGCLNDHMVNEHAFEDVPCQKDNCKLIAYSKKTLAFHMSRFHNFRTRKSSERSTQKSCRYPNCGTTLADSVALRFHYKVHENELEKCYLCGYRAISLSFKEHFALHFDQRHLKCSYCDQRFVSVSHKNKHEKVSHIKCFKCEVCAEEFSSVFKFYKHRNECGKNE